MIGNDQPKAMIREILRCQRCGENHRNVEAKRLTRPIGLIQGGTYEFWALCPISGDPIIISQLALSADDDKP